ncbi:MAG: 4Fe-4S dicluster domain-containing protein [Candidatus Lokiarchaeota archaeon]|nr:4Fe-4S dicluster domain-containing protein [Candidatus Lokiarchaeota archaeon]MBD3200318.1 4Fe-4S dicluster domain-containing protein [Candidatus Lokiarchaeota archaeon]
MKIIGLDDEKCIKCLDCVRECPSGLFIKPPTELGEKRRVIFEDPYEGCIECGHCIAVCPTDAIIYDDADDYLEYEGMKDPSSLIDFETLNKYLRARRSIRNYKDKEVSDEQIKTILEAMRYAPSARNDQAWKYIIVKDPGKIDKIRQSVIKMLALLRKLIKYKAVIKYFLPKSVKEMITEPRTKVSIEDFFKRIDEGEDDVFYNAPVVLVTYTEHEGDMALNDAGITLTHGMLAAQALGLGTCWIGYAQEALNRNKEVKEAIGISKDSNVNGVLIIGHPDVKYHRAPPRKTLDVKWV